VVIEEAGLTKCEREPSDRYTVTVKMGGIIVGHLP